MKNDTAETEPTREPITVTVVDAAGVPTKLDGVRDETGIFVSLPLDMFAVKAPRGFETMTDALARLEAEAAALRPLLDERAEHEKRGQVLAHVAAALGEVAGVNGTGPGVDPWYYKARAALALVGHHVPELRDGHLADIVQAMRDTKAAGAPFRTENVTDKVLEIVGDHPLTLWEGWLAQHYPEAPTSAPPHLINEICPMCQGFGGGPERIRLLCGEVAKRDRVIDHNAEIADAWKARHAELDAAAQTIAADNKAKDDEITQLRAQLQREIDASAQAAKSLVEVVAYAREQANMIDSTRESVTQAAAQIAALTKELAEVRAPSSGVTPSQA